MELSNGLLPSDNIGQTHLFHKWGNGLIDAPSDSLPNKRKRNDIGSENGGACAGNEGQRSFPLKESLKKHSSFVPIDGHRGVYYSECWEPNGTTLYLPVNGSLLANMEKYDQISFEQGFFFIGDASGGFQQKAQGQVIHCWRYSEQERKLFIALSYFFSSFQVFQDVVSSLSCL